MNTINGENIHYGMYHIKFLDLDYVINNIGIYQVKKINGLRISLNSKRLRVFKEKGITCVQCGAIATIASIDMHCKDNRLIDPHINLYGIYPDNSVFVLTQDHIIPKSKNGTNNIENLQPMCCKCNWLKRDV